VTGHVLQLFPPGGIDQTIHVSILIGVLTMLMFAEAYGWVFSGLVVPGYLASLFVLEPGSGAMVVTEAVLTYGIAQLLSGAVSRTGAWTSFFGRERFLLLIFVSIVVRQSSELWVIPDTLRVIDSYFGTNYRLAHTFSSVGLVLVPLTANMFWKLGMRRGIVQVTVPTLITYALVAYVLLPYTNLSFARLEISYEDVALDFFSSPKAYIVLVVGAWIASRGNLVYGWDYAGILVPALLAIAWFSPMRLLTTFAETTLLVLCVRGIVWLPLIRTMNLEGPRRVALVFTTSFMLKYAIGWILHPLFPDLQITDLFGFGYLLPSLIAVKALQKDEFTQVVMPTFAVSVAALAVGSIVGFTLDKLAPAPVPPPLAALVATGDATTKLGHSPMGVLALAHVRARMDVASDLPLERSAYELARYRELWAAIQTWIDTPDKQHRDDVERRATELGLELAPVGKIGQREAFGLFEREERLAAHVGWDTAVLVPGPRPKRPVLGVPRPAREAPAAEAAAVLCQRVDCLAVIASGLDTTDRLEHRAHAIALESFASAPAVEVRADPTLTDTPILHIAHEQPDVNVAALWSTAKMSWDPAPEGTRRRSNVLRAPPDAYWQLVATPLANGTTAGETIDSWFSRFFARPDPRAPPAAAIVDNPPSASEVRFLEVAVAQPALAGKLAAANGMAGLVGYAVTQIDDGAEPVWLLTEATRPRRLGWGVLVGRTSDKHAPIAVEIPRPRREVGTGRLGLELWRQTDASVLVVADGDVPEVRVDADPIAIWNTTTPFQAFHQAVHDRLRTADGALVLQVRGFGVDQPVDANANVVVALGRPLLEPGQVPKRLQGVLANGVLTGLGAPKLHDGAQNLVDLSVIGNPQLQYCGRFALVDCATLWFSDRARDRFREIDRDKELAKFVRMNISLTTAHADAALLEPALTAVDQPTLEKRFAEVERVLEAYATQQNVQLLRVLEQMVASSHGAVWVRGGYSDELARPFVVAGVREGDRERRALVLVAGGTARHEVKLADAKQVSTLLAQRPLVLWLEGRHGR
jgi:gamma-polyglutamate biosynthesis protein CapC